MFWLVCLAVCSYAQDIPSFSGETAFNQLQELVLRGNRHYGASKREEQIEYLTQNLSSYGWNVSLQSFSALEKKSSQEYLLHNIIAIDSKEHTKRIILGTHWDTRLWAEEDPNPSWHNTAIVGANDGSSGVALLLSLAQTLQKHSLQNTSVDIILFDGEEFGRPGEGGYCKGSEYFVEHMERVYPNPPHSVVIVDMIADADLMLETEAYSLTTTPKLWKDVQKHLLQQNIDFRIPPRGIRDDQHPFIQKKIPSILLIDLSYPYWHTQADTLDKCSAKSLEKVGTGLLSWLFAQDNAISDQ